MIPATVTGSDTHPKFFPSKEVWSVQNGTDWPDGIAVLMSFIAIIWTMSGYDAPFHLSEECSNAAVAAPRAIVLTSSIGGLAGWALQLVVAYTVADIPAVLDSDLGQPWASYLVQVMPQNTALAILALTIMCGFFMGQGCMIAASRVTFAYARDDCFPFSSWIKRVNRHTYTPVNAVWFNTVIGCLLLLLIFGGKPGVVSFWARKRLIGRANMGRIRCYWCHFLCRCNRCFCRLYNTHLYSSILRGRPFSKRTLAFG
jgi:amino acid transporter